jgi:hypothetical protein
MSEDQTLKDLKAYKEGYKDGYNEAVRFYILNPMKNMHPDHYVCPICRISGVQLSVCYNPKCPTRAYSGAIGAACSDPFSNLPLGANGPTGV